MDSSCICWRPATGWTTHIIQINPHGIDPIKVAMDDPILEDMTEARERR